MEGITMNENARERPADPLASQLAARPAPSPSLFGEINSTQQQPPPPPADMVKFPASSPRSARATIVIEPGTLLPSDDVAEPTSGSSNTNTDEHADDESMLDNVSFMLDGNLPAKKNELTWLVPKHDSSDLHCKRTIRVVVHAVDDEPGAVQSGHYLWPAAHMLATYCVTELNPTTNSTLAAPPTTCLELGAGCGLVTLACLQLWQRSLQTCIVTDHDWSVLERARLNHESTLEAMMEAANNGGGGGRRGSNDDDDDKDEARINTVINNVVSIPVRFVPHAWGCRDQTCPDNDSWHEVRATCVQHTSPERDTFDVILGSDLIYDVSVVTPLLQSVQALLDVPGGCFWLSQSFAFDVATEHALDVACASLRLVRTVLVDEGDGRRIQEFRHAKTTATAKAAM